MKIHYENYHSMHKPPFGANIGITFNEVTFTDSYPNFIAIVFNSV